LALIDVSSKNNEKNQVDYNYAVCLFFIYLKYSRLCLKQPKSKAIGMKNYMSSKHFGLINQRGALSNAADPNLM
jgi:hypothetical protein